MRSPRAWSRRAAAGAARRGSGMVWSAADLRASTPSEYGRTRSCTPSCRSPASRPASTRHCSTTRSRTARGASCDGPTAASSSSPTWRCGLFLARCLEVDPAAVAYERGVHGKPGLATGLVPLQFSLSHSCDLGLLAVDARAAARGRRRAGSRSARGARHRRRAVLRSGASGASIAASGRASCRVLSLLDAQGGALKAEWQRGSAVTGQLRRQASLDRPSGRSESFSRRRGTLHRRSPDLEAPTVLRRRGASGRTPTPAGSGRCGASRVQSPQPRSYNE